MIDPIAFHVGVFSIRWYGILMFCAIVIAIALFRFLAHKQGIDSTTSLEFSVISTASVFVGFRLFHFIVYEPSVLLSDPLVLLNPTRGGLASHGGIILGPIVAWFYCRKKKLNFWRIADLSVLAISLVVGLIRIGNFINGELVGRKTSSIFGVQFRGYEGKRHPVQLYESIKNFVVFGILYFVSKLKFPAGTLFWLFVFLFSFLRFFTEFFKEYLVFTSGLTVGQYISVSLCVVSLIALYFKKKENRELRVNLN